jgi:hypothetical protein
MTPSLQGTALCMSIQGAAQGKAWSMRFPCYPSWGRYLFLAFFCFLPAAAWGYRPFVSTDAAVAEPQQVEVELGYYVLERDHAEHTFLVSQMVLNYGLVKDLELVGEFQLAWSPGEAKGQRRYGDLAATPGDGARRGHVRL